MTTMTTVGPLSVFLQNFGQIWERSVSAALTVPCKVEVLEEAATPADGAPVAMALEFEGVLTGRAVALMEAEDLGAVNRASTVAESGPVAQVQESQVHAAQEMLRQAIALAVKNVQESGMALRVQVGPLQKSAEKPGAILTIVASADGSPPVRLQLQLSDELTKSADNPDEAANFRSPAPGSAAPETMGLVMDVEVEVTLRFGGRQIPLSELLELGAGSVIELDRQIQEPVDLVLEDRVIARGDVVIVDGNYGLRVTEVCSASRALARP